MERLNLQKLNHKQWNRIKSSGIMVALGICAEAAFMHPTEARSEGENTNGQPPTHQHDGPGNDAPRIGSQPPMRPEERMAEELDLTPAQKTKIKAIFDQEREQMHAIHEKTQANIAALLTPAQNAKFDQMPKPGHGPRGDGPEMRGEMQDDDHGRPVELIAKDLGVTPEKFR